MRLKKVLSLLRKTMLEQSILNLLHYYGKKGKPLVRHSKLTNES